MASGFLVLPDGRCLARRWCAYDEVLRAVAAQLGEESAAQQLKHWLLEQLPGVNDIEEIGIGAWRRTADQETVVRHIDLRKMTVENQRLFCQAAKRAARAGHPEEGLRECLADLAEMIERGERGEHPLSKSDWGEVLDPTGEPVGPGWLAVRMTIRRYVGDDLPPGTVEFELVDIRGRVYRFIDESVVSLDNLDADSRYPRPTKVAVEVLRRFQDAQLGEVVRIDTSRPWGIRSIECETQFDVLPESLTEL